MKNHKIVDGEKVFLTEDEETEKAIRDSKPPASGVIQKDPFKETMIDMMAELSGKSKSEIETMIEDKIT